MYRNKKSQSGVDGVLISWRIFSDFHAKGSFLHNLVVVLVLGVDPHQCKGNSRVTLQKRRTES